MLKLLKFIWEFWDVKILDRPKKANKKSKQG